DSAAWFIGIPPELVAGVWTGAEDRGISFSSMRYGQGAAAAMPVFGLYMRKVYADKELNYSQEDFPMPEGGITRFEMDCANFSQFYGSDPSQQESQPIDDNRLGF